MKQETTGLLIALSAGGSNEELAAEGLGIEHVEELMVRLATKLLTDSHRLGFGGTLGDSKKRLARFLIDAAESWLDEESARHSDVNRPETWPLVNWSAWPFYESISEGERAELVGICHFVNVDPQGVRKTSLDKVLPNWQMDPRGRKYAADGLSTMRELSTRQTDLRIVWGGRIAGAMGWMAGILEEVAFSLAQGKPLLVLGGFGGCARLLADFLGKKDARWPDRLSPAACADPERDKLQTAAKRKELDQRFKLAKKQLSEFHSKLHSAEKINGLPSDLVREALREETARKAIRLAAEAAKEVTKATMVAATMRRIGADS